jgi:hypothetical protein
MFSLSLPIDTACCVVDLILGGWDNVLFRVGTAALVLLENEILLWGLEDLMLVRGSSRDWLLWGSVPHAGGRMGCRHRLFAMEGLSFTQHASFARCLMRPPTPPPPPPTFASQNFKSAVRRLEHTTLLLTALALPQQPDLLMLWATEGYSPFVEPSEGPGVGADGVRTRLP